MPRTTTRRIHAGRTLAAALGALLLAGCSTPAAPHSTTDTPAPSASANDPTGRPARTGFTVYDTTFYANLDLTQIGVAKADIIYASAVAVLSGQTDPGGPNGGPKTELALPPKDAYQQLVRQHLTAAGPLVLDYETLYLQGTPEDAQRHYQKLSTLLQWTHEAAPGKKVGFWGVLGNTQPAYYPLARTLAQNEDVFFPDLYTFSPDRGSWQKRLDRDLAEAKQIAPDKPVYPFLWPQYPEHTPNANQYLPADLWAYELTACAKTANSVVLWGGSKNGNSNQAWVDTTKQFLAHL
ncbi:hypothetical protein [Kitasatospora sp. NPDC017646]|uniref:hypothetical protein n=1 Tax=Kitasatospora sp. NPDC017646 TaxID=3364024 RepID=UPI0037AA1C11